MRRRTWRGGKDRRYTSRLWDQKTERVDELSESEDEEMAEAVGVRKQPGAKKRRGIMDYRNPHAPAEDSGANTPADDARSLDGDVGMGLDGAGDERAEGVRATNAAVQKDLLAMKAEGKSPALAGLERQASNQSEAGADDDEDEDMDVDPSTTVQGTTAQALATGRGLAPGSARRTPSSRSPVPRERGVPGTETAGLTGAAPPVSTAGADVEMSESAAKEREAGLMERTLEDAEGEATTEMRGGGHNVGGGPAV